LSGAGLPATNSHEEKLEALNHMKKILIIASLLGIGFTLTVWKTIAQEKAAAGKYEYAIVKWDGPDRLFYNLPDRFEMVHVGKAVKIPGDAQEEEWCLAYASNKMAADGWEPVNLDSRRIVFRRAK
jgi:hypothetical protein